VRPSPDGAGTWGRGALLRGQRSYRTLSRIFLHATSGPIPSGGHPSRPPRAADRLECPGVGRVCAAGLVLLRVTGMECGSAHRTSRESGNLAYTKRVVMAAKPSKQVLGG